ncbi:MAG: ABC transporter permease [Lachnospiraceae bacterium]|nr:ABC transporter permease [Lachnospiraceae bacterium]
MKSKFTGVMNVFKFSYIQILKSKAFIISTAIFVAIGLLALPIMTAISRAGEDDVKTDKAEYIGTVYVCDKALDGKLAESLVDIIKENPAYSEKNFVLVEENDYEKTFDGVKASKNGDVLVDIKFDNEPSSLDYGFSYVVFFGEEIEELEDASNEFSMYIDNIHKEALGKIFISTEEGANLVSYNYISEIVMIDGAGNVVEDEEGLDMAQYWITYVFLFLALIGITFLGQKVSDQIVTEKSSKVIEYIMTSIKPMALVMGKVMASIANIFTMLGLTIVAFIGSIFINGALFKNPDGSMYVPGFVKTIANKQLLEGLSLVNIVSSVLVFILGFVVYGLIAGVSGAMVSKVEEMAEGMKMFSFAMIIGAYVVIAYMSVASTGNDLGVFTNFVYLFPLCSPFIVPASLFLGKMTVGMGFLSVGILLVTMIVMLYFVSGIYEYLIYYSGEPLKFKELIRLFRKKGGAK